MVRWPYSAVPWTEDQRYVLQLALWIIHFRSILIIQSRSSDNGRRTRNFPVQNQSSSQIERVTLGSLLRFQFGCHVRTISPATMITIQMIVMFFDQDFTDPTKRNSKCTTLHGLAGSSHCKHATVHARPRQSNFCFDILRLNH